MRTRRMINENPGFASEATPWQDGRNPGEPAAARKGADARRRVSESAAARSPFMDLRHGGSIGPISRSTLRGWGSSSYSLRDGAPSVHVRFRAYEESERAENPWPTSRIVDRSNNSHVAELESQPHTSESESPNPAVLGIIGASAPQFLN